MSKVFYPLPSPLQTAIAEGYLKAVDVIEFLSDDGWQTSKDLANTSLLDLSKDGLKIVSAAITGLSTLELTIA
jgi:hypothetical protein